MKGGKLRILHITNWYPNEANPYEALWIQRQIRSLEPYCEHFVAHIQVIPSSRLRWKRKTMSEGVQVMIEIPTQKWAVVEYVTYCILRRWLAKLQVNSKFDLINFHIAYPLLTYWHKIKTSVSIPVLVNEHWSAYHFHFNVSRRERLRRILKIFSHRLPMIVVSKSLKNDITTFSEKSDAEIFIVPNAVDTTLFTSHRLKPGKEPFFFMVSLWKYPKDPFTVITAFSRFISRNKLEHLKLVIGGYGPLVDEMRECVKHNALEENVSFYGQMNPNAIALNMNASLAFLHCSHYETFSVVCAEALCCGAPVIASAVGGIKEYVTQKNGILVNENSVEAWVGAMELFWSRGDYDRPQISRQAHDYFSVETVGQQYFKVVRQVYDKGNYSISSHT